MFYAVCFTFESWHDALADCPSFLEAANHRYKRACLSVMPLVGDALSARGPAAASCGRVSELVFSLFITDYLHTMSLFIVYHGLFTYSVIVHCLSLIIYIQCL